MISKAIGVAAYGAARVEKVGPASKLGAYHPMGPLGLGDLVGPGFLLTIMEVLQIETGDPKGRPHPSLRKYVRGGWLARGRHFHEYQTAGLR